MIYTCKCGKTFEKTATSVTTEYCIPRAEYNSHHECFGCLFCVDKNYESKRCRATRNEMVYGTTASCIKGKAAALHVTSLDFDFINSMSEFYNSLGVESAQEPPYAGIEDGSGRYPFTFNFPKNLRGENAKRALIAEFFNPVEDADSYRELYTRKDMTDVQEKEKILNDIKLSKEEAGNVSQTSAPTEEPNEQEPLYPVEVSEDTGSGLLTEDDEQPAETSEAEDMPTDSPAEEEIEQEDDTSPTPCEWENASGAEPDDEDEESSEAEFPPG